MRYVRFATAAALAVLSLTAASQPAGVTLPPDGDNEKSSVTQQIGLVTVGVDYSSPRVHRDGKDRTGKIWGELVPYGLHDLGFNDCKSCPWRAGANENTVFTVSHDVKVDGKPLPAGRYGLHMLAGKDVFTVIFSKTSTAWGSYSYDPKDDQLRVDVKPVAGEFREWLTYEFLEREPAKATLALMWENLRVPMTITVDDPADLYIANLRKELVGGGGFEWQNLLSAARFGLRYPKHHEQALIWARRSAFAPGIGQENFQTLSMVAQLETATGKTADAEKTMDKAMALPGTTPVQIHQYGRQLLQAGKKAEAMKIFQTNAKRFPNQWPVNVGLARGYAANGDDKKALEHARLALGQAPDDVNRKAMQAFVDQLEKGKK